MSSSPPKSQPSQLQLLSIESIKANPRNPRLIFPQAELDKLADSIDQFGIKVPIAVFRDPDEADKFVLIDGERRYKAALMLGLESIPAIVTEASTNHEVLVEMFNIHLVREPWRDLPTALALGQLIEEEGDDVTDKRLKELTGLSIERVRQLRFVLELPDEWQGYIGDGTIPLNFFWELKRNVIDVMAKKRPKLYEELGANEGVAGAFVKKRLAGVITDTVGLRKVRPIITFAADDAAESDDDSSVLDANLRDLVTNEDLSIDEVYEDTVQIMVEVDKLERRLRSTQVSVERLLARATTDDEKARVRTLAGEHIDALQQILK